MIVECRANIRDTEKPHGTELALLDGRRFSGGERAMPIQKTENKMSGSRESLSDRIHQRACEAASRHRKIEAELIEILQQVEQHRVFLARGQSSLFPYVVKELGLSESVAYNLISVARKSREVPELKAEIQKGAITLSNARKIVPVLNRENKAEWLIKASTLSQRQLEREVVRVRPQLATPERAMYVTPSRVKLEVGLSEKDMLKLRRVQDLFCQSRQRAVTLEDVLVALTDEFLVRHDPLEKAKRQKVRIGLQKIESAGEATQSPTKSIKTPVALQVRAATPVETREENCAHAEKRTRTEGANDKTTGSHVRKAIPAKLLHQINLRDERRCTHTNQKGERCNQTRWIEAHHVTPVSRGGTNTLGNLRTLCSGHHRWIHGQ